MTKECESDDWAYDGTGETVCTGRLPAKPDWKFWLWSPAATKLSPGPKSEGGGVFSRCLMGSGAAGAAGLYANGV